MSDKEKLKNLEKALNTSADFSEEVLKKFERTDKTIANQGAAIKQLSKTVAIIGSAAGLSTGGIIGILAAPYVAQFIKSLF